MKQQPLNISQQKQLEKTFVQVLHFLNKMLQIDGENKLYIQNQKYARESGRSKVTQIGGIFLIGPILYHKRLLKIINERKVEENNTPYCPQTGSNRNLQSCIKPINRLHNYQTHNTYNSCITNYQYRYVKQYGQGSIMCTNILVVIKYDDYSS